MVTPKLVKVKNNILYAKNNLTEDAQKTFTTHLESAGTNVLRWQNPNAFSASWAVQIGETGEEQTEIKLLGTVAVAGVAGTLGTNTLYEHPANTPLYATKYDQIVFEVATTGTAGTAVAIAGGTVTIQPDSEYTTFDHTAGSPTYAYKIKYLNSVLGSTSTESDWCIATIPFYALIALRQRVKDKLWDANFVSDDQIDDWHNEWLDEMNNTMLDVNEDYGLGSTSVGFSGTAEFGTITASDFQSVRRVWMTTDGDNYYQATKMEMTQFLPDQEFNTTNPYFFMYGDNILGRRPNGDSGTAGVIYQKLAPHLDDEMDEIPLPMRPYTNSFVDYALAQAYYKDSREEMGDRFDIKAQRAKERFKVQLTPRSKTGATMIDIVEDIGQDMIIEP